MEMMKNGGVWQQKSFEIGPLRGFKGVKFKLKQNLVQFITRFQLRGMAIIFIIITSKQ